VQSTLAGFIGYRYKKLFSVGAEYNQKFNESFKEDYNRFGYSVYGSYNVWKMIQLFARYDWVGSNMLPDDDSPWNLTNDGSSIIAGVQYQPVKQLKFALNYRDWFPYASNLNNETYIYLNLEYNY
jgi:hypothetical protein